MKPILFNTEMVRAILDGRKMVTRRVVKPANSFRNCEGYRQGSGLWIDGYSKDDEPNGHIKDYSVSPCWYRKEDYISRYAPYKVNDILYVRETWCSAYDGEVYFYLADKVTAREQRRLLDYNTVKWRPSIHMPKDAARIFLKVTGVRVERLCEITEEQAKAEGVAHTFDDIPDAEYTNWTKKTGCYPKRKEEWGYKNYLWHGNFGKYGSGNWQSDLWEYQYSEYDKAVGSFFSLWNSLLKKDQLQYYGFNANPYVWVIEFEVIDKAAALKEGQT